MKAGAVERGTLSPPRSASGSPPSARAARASPRSGASPSTRRRHAVDQLARRGLVAGIAGLADPVGEAVAAEAGEAHQLDVLRVVRGGASGAPAGGRRRRPRRRAARRAGRNSYPSRLILVLGLVLARPPCHRRSAHAEARTAQPQGQDPRHASARRAARPRCSRRLLRAGADAFRVNMSHGDHAHARRDDQGDPRAREGVRPADRDPRATCRGPSCASAPSRTARR